MNLPSKNEIQNIRSLTSIITSYWNSQSLYAAVDLGLFDYIKNEITFDDLVKQLDFNKKTVVMLLKILTKYELITHSNQNLKLTKKGELLTSDHPFSMVPATYVFCTNHYLAWLNVTDALITSQEVFSKTHTQKFFPWLLSNEVAKNYYYNALNLYALIDYLPIMPSLELGSTIIDIGCGKMGLLQLLKYHYPDKKYLGYDLPELKNYEQTGIEFHGGDFFKDQIPNADTIILSRILHDWDDSDSSIILQNCIRALNPKGNIIIIEAPISENLDHNWGATLDINMRVMIGGSERNILEFNELFVNNGLNLKDTKLIKESNLIIYNLEIK